MDIKKIVQEAYDAVINQGGPSMDVAGCCYRSPAGRKCIIGHMIPDKHYRRDMEDKGVEPLMDSFKVPTLEALRPKVHVLKALQLAHDRAAWDIQTGHRRSDVVFLVVFKARMLELSKIFNLELKV